MADSHQKKVFVPPKRRLLISRLKQDFPEIAILILTWIIFDKPDIQFAVIGTSVIGVIEFLRLILYSKKQEASEIVVSSQDIYGMPEVPWFNGFRKLEKISIPFEKIDRQKTRIEKSWYSSTNLIWSTEGQNILVSGAFEEEQLRDIARLIGCPAEL
jgi:hypothetical protein